MKTYAVLYITPVLLTSTGDEKYLIILRAWPKILFYVFLFMKMSILKINRYIALNYVYLLYFYYTYTPFHTWNINPLEIICATLITKLINVLTKTAKF